MEGDTAGGALDAVRVPGGGRADAEGGGGVDGEGAAGAVEQRRRGRGRSVQRVAGVAEDDLKSTKMFEMDKDLRGDRCIKEGSGKGVTLGEV